jgi:hypothetical protein
MPLEVVGAGFGRTGTLSLKLALEKLGYQKCYHMMEVFRHPNHIDIWQAAQRGEPVDWEALFAGYRASVDWPACNSWRELADRYPDAKVILSTRDPRAWYQSVMRTIYPGSMSAKDSEEPTRRKFGEWAWDHIWKGVFDGRMDDEAHVIDVYRHHEETVKSAIPSTRLLVVEASRGWGPLCEFLGRPVPGEPYPKVNTSEEFLARGTSSN